MRISHLVTYGVLLPLCALIALVFTAVSLPSSVRAAHGEGLAGTFTAEREQCGPRGRCNWYGSYVSDDGSVRFDDVLLDGLRADRGDRVPALYEGQDDPPLVYSADGSKEWIGVVICMLIAAGYLVWCAWWLVRRLRTEEDRLAPTPSR